MRFYETIVVIPVGPGTRTDFIADTINSFTFYTRCTHRIILSDDSQQGIGRKIQEQFPDVDVIRTKKNGGAMAGLYITLAEAFDYAVQNYKFDLLLKLDTDALVIGARPEEEGRKLFAANPRMGIAGQYPLDYEGKPWDTGWPKARITNGTMTWKFIRRPVANFLLRRLYQRALRNGYHTGESVFGGAYFINPALLKSLKTESLLPHYALRTLNIGEDHIFSLLAKSIGFELGDLSAGALPFGCAWKGLPASPEDLLQNGKRIIHSTRGWKNMSEEEIRSYFRQKREQPAPAPSGELAIAG